MAHEVRSVELRSIDKLPVTTPVADVKHRKRFGVVQKAGDDCLMNSKGWRSVPRTLKFGKLILAYAAPLF